MGLLDSVIGSVVGQVLGGGREPARQGDPSRGGGVSTGALLSSPIVQALIMLLLSKAGGGLGDLLGGGAGGRSAPRGPDGHERSDGSDGPTPYGRGPESGDLGGFGGPAPRGGDDFSDLAGMLDGPGERATRSPGQGPYAGLDRDPEEPAGVDAAGDGLGGLIERFQRGGLGDVIGSWIGGGGNQPITPNRLADALGSDTVETLSQRTGLGRDELLGQLAQALPAVVDRLTPDNRRPSRDEMRGWL